MKIPCWMLGGHQLNVALEWPGKSGGSVRIVNCHRCPAHWIMSDNHKAFLRFDNDQEFAADLARMYPQVRTWLLS